MAGNKRRRIDPEGLVGDVVPGSIEKIELQHFMCHTYFEVVLSPTVNFIVGRNGSGKSAILMALVIGLGGKSSATNRAPNMTEFIKQGSTWAQVTISICNSNINNDAWEHELYGDSVIVERKITKKSSQYKLKSSAGKQISSQKKDLTLLLDHYNIQVNNPVSILNQEMSKMFLASTDPSDKYKFFMKSTHLEQMIEDYQCINERLETTNHTIKKKEKSIPDVKFQVRHLAIKYNEISELKDLGEKVSKFKDELIWIKVREIEDERAPIQRNLDKLSDVLPNIETKITSSTEKYNEAEAQVKAIENEITAAMTTYNSLESDQASLRQVANAKKRLLYENRNSQKRTQRSIQEVENDRKHLLKGIQEIQESNAARNMEAERTEKDRELGECKEKMRKVTDSVSQANSSIESLERQLGSMNEEVSTMRGDIDQTDNEIRKLENLLRTQQEAKKNRVRVFGRFMPELLRKIEELHVQGRFRHKPRGPFGLHIKVKDPKWASVVELAIGGAMCNFVVHDQHDKGVLQDLFRQCCQNHREWPNLILMKFREDFYDVNVQKPQTGHTTLYDMLEIEDNMISNALVEQFRMEQCLLIESSEEARRLIVGSAPRNVFQAWTLSGDDVRERGAYSNDLSRRSTQYFRHDPSQVIEELRTNIGILKRQSEEHHQNKKALEKETLRVRSQYNSEKSKLQALKKEISKLRARLIELDNVEEVPLLDATAMEEEVAQYSEQITQHQIHLEDLKRKEDTLHKEWEEADARHTESQERDSSITNTLEDLKQKLTTGQTEVTKKLGVLDACKRKKKDISSKIKESKTDLKKKETEVEAAQALARQRCERVDSTRNSKDLEQQIRNMEIRIQQGTKTSVNVEDITRRYHEAKRKYEDIKSSVKTLKTFARRLEQTLDERQDKYFLFRKEITLRMNYFFMMNLSQRGYNGKLSVNHDKGQLKMQLNVDTSGSSQDTHDVRTLSGGERSFSTVCFICSLWNIMESPFRCLDEFDVFMDLYNRRITMNLLMEHASQTAKSRQYILFTPQDMSTFSKKFKNIKILQLAAPERNDDE